MRTTVKIADEQYRALTAIAQRRGLRGYSALIQEALDEYLANLNVDDVDLLLGLEGMLTDSDAHQMRSRIYDVRTPSGMS
jgi:metal-responsive CopG/Arc/MetJ family transcriptional regulator